MLVAIDIGNTTITIGLSSNQEDFSHIYRLNTEKTKSADEYAITLNELIKQASRVIISSVVPEMNEVFRDYFEKQFGIVPLFLGAGVKTGIRIFADNPKEVGADLIGNSIAATEIYHPTCLIIDLGTATTFTYLENMNLRGVIIAPGLTTSRNALISKTSLLPQVELEAPKKILGTNSNDAIRSGLVLGHAAMIDGMIFRIKESLKLTTLTVVLTGGHAKIVRPHCRETMILDESLILKGLLIVNKLNPVFTPINSH
ncbi:MAG: type III pantothenate kinase [Candidatus Izemoplasmatales bacterium]|jgi:type III pantothenate kinase|nr:type III pantothenate kinase [Candidatus Izemoplasmatales bacterium]NLF48228.1 type III pantothenate kinase [Acholeplasmataceae bacterium]MDD4354434.1 type III pantothenate kinase [Candidatus Izemoplasmatales bacterium]MDD4987732.1 type III pantothenate kinase [Candidatus Izemoplasmatales bacterium]MDD5601420.1 type III pantothenate kinase [Candidatus Izemoplasmatales bacterium]